MTRDKSAAVECAQKGKESRWLRNCGWSGVVDVGSEGECVGVGLAKVRERFVEKGVMIVVRRCRRRLVRM